MRKGFFFVLNGQSGGFLGVESGIIFLKGFFYVFLVVCRWFQDDLGGF